jgi:uncharacterized protein with HEPN domain
MSKGEKLRIPNYLNHILEAVARINEYVADIDEAAFISDQKTQDAVIRNFEIIGEACNNISKYHGDFAAKHTDIPWSFAYEMRNALAHGYFKVDLEIVWKTIHRDLPNLASQVTRVLNTLS